MALASEVRSRRTLLAAGLGGLGAFIAQAVGRPVQVRAGGQALTLGTTNVTDASYTEVNRADLHSRISFCGAYSALVGEVDRQAATALWGRAGGNGSTAVAGTTDGSATQVAIDADVTSGNGNGYAVRARAGNGIGVYASATGGYALQAEGRTIFSRSGKVTFPAGQVSRTLTGRVITADSLVLATIQGNVEGTWVKGVSTSDTHDSFTIRLNRSAPKTLTVGWFIVN